MQRVILMSCFSVLIAFSCNKKDDKLRETKPVPVVVEDNFESSLKDFWGMDIVDSSRYKIVRDPLNSNNNVLKINLNVGDAVSNGKRSEFVFLATDSIGYKTNYSFKFMFPAEFFQQDDPEGITIIHQWHDQPDPGFSWSTQNKSTHPPVYLLIEKNSLGENYLFFKTGLESGGLNEVVSTKWNEPLIPDIWYNFSCEIYWHMYSNIAYAIPKLNDEYMYTIKNKVQNDSIAVPDTIENHKIYRRNMYNSISNYFKMGIYRFSEKHNKTMFFDDFKYESIKIQDCN